MAETLSNRIFVVLFVCLWIGASVPTAGFTQTVAVRVAAPDRVLIPEHIPSWGILQNSRTFNKQVLLFPRALYEDGYLTAWNECLFRYGNLKCSIEDLSKMTHWHSAGLEWYTGFGLNSGKNDAVKLLSHATESDGEETCRASARAAYVEMNVRDGFFSPARSKYERLKSIGKDSLNMSNKPIDLNWKAFDGELSDLEKGEHR